MPHVDLIAALLPSSYAVNTGSVRAEIAADGKALDRVSAAVYKAAAAVRPADVPLWMAAYEELYGLPVMCGRPDHNHAPLHQDRQHALAAALLERGGVTKEWIERYARMAGGENITVTTAQPFEAGRSTAGETVSNGPWRFVFFVNAPTMARRRFAAGRSVAAEALSTWGNDGLECLIERKKPAHTVAIFRYEDQSHAQD